MGNFSFKSSVLSLITFNSPNNSVYLIKSVWVIFNRYNQQKAMMDRMIKRILVPLFIVITFLAYGQSDKEKAQLLGETAIKLMDEGKIEESMQLLEQAQKLDSTRFDYPYEIALAHYQLNDYNATIEILEKISGYNDITDHYYQLLGNSYDNIKNTDKAVETYQAGLKKFPESGRLYLELGIIQMSKKEYTKAVNYFEKGIEVEPSFPSNYYWAAKFYCSSTEKVWGMIYGEIFMNLERNSKRTAEISKLLFDTYKSSITISSKSSMSIHFCHQMVMNADVLKDTSKMKLPFCMAYEMTTLTSMAFEKKIDINSLDNIRDNFLSAYFKNGYNTTYPNVLYDYQHKVLDAGYIDAYNHWILMKGDEDNFNKWQAKNKDNWDKFLTWFKDNQLHVDPSNKFLSKQY